VIPGSPTTAHLRHLLTALATAGRTGALHVEGSPGGTFYLVDGRIAHAESPAAPGVGERLVASGRLAEAAWAAAYQAGHDERRVGALLVQRGHLVQGELVARVLATIHDATHAILQTDDAPVRFVPDERHWLGPVTELDVAALGGEAARRRVAAAPTVRLPIHPTMVVLPAPSRSGAGRRPTAVGRVEIPQQGVPNALPERRPDSRRMNAGPQDSGAGARRPAPDYATLKRIRTALKSVG
jgi:hypothetical protein